MISSYHLKKTLNTKYFNISTSFLKQIQTKDHYSYISIFILCFWGLGDSLWDCSCLGVNLLLVWTTHAIQLSGTLVCHVQPHKRHIWGENVDVQSEQCVLLLNHLLVRLFLCSIITFFFLIGLATSKHWFRRNILGTDSSFACWQFLVLCSGRWS